MSDTLITTTVSLDVGAQDPQMVIHLMMGNYGTRALRLVPVDNARLMDMDNFAGASVGMSCAGRENLEIDCVMGDHYVTLVPTKAMTEQADEWLCQLNLYDAQQQVLSSAPFKIIVHGSVYAGDAVEHTNSGVTALYFDSQGYLTAERLDGGIVRAGNKYEHVHPVAVAPDEVNDIEGLDGFMSKEDKAKLESLSVGQDVSTDSDVTFKSITVTDGTHTITINGTTISGATFT